MPVGMAFEAVDVTVIATVAGSSDSTTAGALNVVLLLTSGVIRLAATAAT